MAVYDTAGGENAHIDQVLTQISIGYPNNEFVGPAFFPEVPVMKQSDKYSIWGRESWVLEPGVDFRAPGAESYEIPGVKRSLSPYYAQEHSLQIAVTDEERENADAPLAPDRDGTELVTAKLLLGRELEMKGILHTTGNYASGHTVTLSGTSQWSDYTGTSKPTKDVKDGRRMVHSKLFREITKTMIPWQVMSYLEDHPEFIDRIKYSQMGVVTKDIIGTVMGISNIVVPEVGYNSAAMGLTETLAYLWGKNVVMAYVPDRPGMKIPAFAYEFCWKYKGGPTQITERWRENRRKSDIIRVSRRWDIKITTVDGGGLSTAGYLIVNAIA